MGDARLLPAVTVVAVREGCVLALRRSASAGAAVGCWETPSGRLEPGEDPLAAARRELREETGWEGVFDDRPVDAYRAARGDEPMLVVVYRARVDEERPRLAEAHDAWRWLSTSQLGLLSWPRLVEAARRALRMPW